MASSEARAASHAPTPMPTRSSRRRLAGRRAFTLADCAAAPALHYARVVSAGTRRAWRTSRATSARSAHAVGRADRRRPPWRSVFPLPWPEYAERPRAAPAVRRESCDDAAPRTESAC